MKQTILLSICLLLLSGTTPKEKKYVFNEQQGNAIYNILEFSKKYLPTSRAQGAEIMDRLILIDSIEKVIFKQYKDQSDTSNIKHPDSTKIKH